jgi:hypothetical protein
MICEYTLFSRRRTDDATRSEPHSQRQFRVRWLNVVKGTPSCPLVSFVVTAFLNHTRKPNHIQSKP